MEGRDGGEEDGDDQSGAGGPLAGAGADELVAPAEDAEGAEDGAAVGEAAAVVAHRQRADQGAGGRG